MTGVVLFSLFFIPVYSQESDAVRLTPTEKDDGAVERVGKYLKKLMNFLKIGNNIKK